MTHLRIALRAVIGLLATTATFEYEDPPTTTTEPKVIGIDHVSA
jgi:hypothetical protein